MDAEIVEKSKKVLIAGKTLLAAITLIVGGQATVQIVNSATQSLHSARKALIRHEVERDLAGLPVTIDITKKPNPRAVNLSNEELVKLVWVLSVENDRLKYQIQTAVADLKD